MKLAANISHLWADLPWVDRFAAAAAAGFSGVEALFPYDAPANETQEALRRCELSFVLLNAPPPNYTGGPRGFAAVSGLEQRFDHDMRRAFRYASAFGAKYVHVMSGVASGKEARETFVKNLSAACAKAPKGVTLTIEPLNTADMPGYFMNDYDLAVDIIEAVGMPNLALQFDSYHAQVITGDACKTFEAHADRIRHIQIGDAPSRVPPGLGTIDFEALFAAILAAGYTGWVSAEYVPGVQTEKTLTWLPSALAKAS